MTSAPIADGLTPGIAPWLLARLACPVHGHPLVEAGDHLLCRSGESYPIVEGIPVLLRSDVRQTHPEAARSLTAAAEPPMATSAAKGEIDPFVQQALLATNGYMYGGLRGRLTTYPIPSFRLSPERPGDLLLDVGCNWGRWSIAAARAGFRAIGVDPSLTAVLAARRVAASLGADAAFVVADARYLPFLDNTFDVVYSYSVWQHFAKADTGLALLASARVLRPGGRAFVQMANAFGLRSLYHQARRRFRAARHFEVRYWTPRELAHAFEHAIGPATLSVDGFFSLNPQTADLPLLPPRYQRVVRASDALRRASAARPWLRTFADSLFVTARKPGATS